MAAAPGGGRMSERALVLWLPDWPVTAFRRTQAREHGSAPDADEPIAIVHAHRVVACSASARADGVRAGQRRRDAQAACPRVRIVAADDGRDVRAFHTVLRLLEELSPGVQPLRPGLAALRARGPSRFYGGETAAAEALLTGLAEAGYTGARVGVADGVFTAEQAARAAPVDAPCRIVPADGAAEFLAPLSVRTLGDEEIALLLTRLGVRTLGELALLDARLVGERLGERGLLLHALARGADARRVVPRVPPPELAREIALEPPLALAEQVAFAARRTAESFCEAIGREQLVCTAVRIVLEDDADGRSERVWQHPLSFDAAAVVDRIRWQLEDGASPGGEGLTGAVALVRIEPEAVDDGAGHQPALIGQGPNERAHHAMTRVQALLGHRGVLSPSVGGGRDAREREVLRPWADGAAASGRERPWPGSLPSPLPAVVFRQRRPAAVLGPREQPVTIDERGLLSAPPATLDGRPIASWAGPWPLVEHDWDAERARAVHRFQLVDDTGAAWLAARDADRWWLEGRYA